MSARSSTQAIEILKELSPELASKIHRGSEQLELLPAGQSGTKDHKWLFVGVTRRRQAGHECQFCGCQMRRRKGGRPTYFDASGIPLPTRPECTQVPRVSIL